MSKNSINSYVDIRDDLEFRIDMALDGCPIDPKIKKAAMDRIMESLSSNHIHSNWDGNLIISGGPVQVIRSLSYYAESLPLAFENLFGKNLDVIRNPKRPKLIRKQFYSTIKKMSDSLNSGTELDNGTELDGLIGGSLDMFLNGAAEIGYAEHKNADSSEALVVGLTRLVDPDNAAGILNIRKTVEYGVKVYSNYYAEDLGKRVEKNKLNELTDTIINYLGDDIILFGKRERVVSNFKNFGENLSRAYDDLLHNGFNKENTDFLLQYHIKELKKGKPYVEHDEEVANFLKTSINLLAGGVVRYQCYKN